jgi:hypothetical protein
MRRAEAAWVRCLLAEISNGNFPDLAAWREFHDTGHVAAEFTEMLAEEGGTARD